LGSLVAGFKATSTRNVNRLRQSPGVRLWQRNYYEHVIRNEDDRNSLCAYIKNNPREWEEGADNLFPRCMA
jgi:REP element-mobilizing transposase RayT